MYSQMVVLAGLAMLAVMVNGETGVAVRSEGEVVRLGDGGEDCRAIRMDIVQLRRDLKSMIPAARSCDIQDRRIRELEEELEFMKMLVVSARGGVDVPWYEELVKWLDLLGFFKMEVYGAIIMMYSWVYGGWAARLKCMPVVLLCSPPLVLLWGGIVTWAWAKGWTTQGVQAMAEGWRTRCPSCLGGASQEDGVVAGQDEVRVEMAGPVSGGPDAVEEGEAGVGASDLLASLLRVASPLVITRMLARALPRPTLMEYILGLVTWWRPGPPQAGPVHEVCK